MSRFFPLSGALLATLPFHAIADETKVRAAFEALGPDIVVERVTLSSLPGFYEVKVGPEIVFMSADGRFLIDGSVIEVPTQTNLTEAARSKDRKAVLDAIPTRTKISFEPAEVNHRVTVFTDIDCGYCRKLHEGIDDLLAAGVAVDYVLYPRAGLQSASGATAVAVFCGEDPASALTDAKAGRNVPQAVCEHSIAQGIDLGRQLRFSGTPAVFDSTGRQIGGYLAPDDLVARLNGPR